MSSFIVSQECINNVINGLYWNHRFKDINYCWLKQFDLDTTKSFKAFGDKLYAMNAKAVGECYGKKTKAPKFKWVDKNISPMQFLKSLQCLIYQCSEGYIVHTFLFKELVDLERRLMSHIINDMPEYKEAEWG